MAYYYMGGSMCQFFTIAIYNGTTNPFTGQPLISLPMLSVAARNNRILNVTQADWQVCSLVQRCCCICYRRRVAAYLAVCSLLNCLQEPLVPYCLDCDD